MRLSLICISIISILILSAIVCAAPLDRRAYNILEMVKGDLVLNGAKQLTEQQIRSAVEASESESVQVRMAAAYALAFIDSEAGENALNGLVASPDPRVAGIAAFSKLRKHTGHLKKQELVAVLSFELGQSPQPWTRALLVSLLGDNFEGDVVPLFIVILKQEKESLVREELLFQIACHGDANQLKEAIVFLQEMSVLDRAFASFERDFLNGVAQNPIKRSPMPGALQALIESRLKEKR